MIQTFFLGLILGSLLSLSYRLYMVGRSAERVVELLESCRDTLANIDAYGNGIVRVRNPDY